MITQDVNWYATGIADISQKTLAIVRFSSSGGQRHIHYQVTIDPDKISANRTFIRFGGYPSDEITGWQPVDDVVICETLSEDFQGLDDRGQAIWGKP